ncbi:MAG TPA: hypothetical protein VK306_01650 [Acidimicrobiales bacterium]|nr:hypothetical protein [Acidimicrobiales bacterium]
MGVAALRHPTDPSFPERLRRQGAGVLQPAGSAGYFVVRTAVVATLVAPSFVAALVASRRVCPSCAAWPFATPTTPRPDAGDDATVGS